MELSCKTHWYKPLSMRTLECKTLDEVRGRRLLGEGHLSDRGRLVEEIRSSLLVIFFSRADIILFKVSDDLLSVWHSEYSIPRLLHYIVTLLIAKILLNCEFKLEILILVVMSYCGISNMVSRRLLFYLFISKYFFACYLFVIGFFFSNCYQTIICTFFSCWAQYAVNWGSCVGRIFFTDLVLGLYN